MGKTLLFVLAVLLLSAGCITDQQIAKEGDVVEVDYVGRLTTGVVFDTSQIDIARSSGVYSDQRTYGPLRFRLGSGEMISGFDKGVVGMNVGETKEIRILPADAYGDKDPKKMLLLPMDAFTKNGVTPVVGETYPTAFGQAKVISITSNGTVLLDYNHPLAGETLVFQVTLVSVNQTA